MDYPDKPEDDQTLNEPQASYNAGGSGRIRIFSSFREQEDEMVAYWASITPLQRLKHLHEMVIHAYGLTEEKLKNPNLGNSLKIIYYEQ